MPKTKFVMRNTARKIGRNIMMTPKNTLLRKLSCGRIILNTKVNKVSVDPNGSEVALICLKGEGAVEVDGQQFLMKPYDALYLPPNTKYVVSTLSGVDFAEASAPSKKQTRLQFVSFDAVQSDPKLHVQAGKETYSRVIYKLVDTNVNASRLLCGITMGAPGNWTSWSPHEHAKSKEEVYLYINMPKPAFGIQIMYDDLKKPYLTEPVFEDDAVIVTKGYHPNVGIPGYGINFVWMMAAHREDVDRDWDLMHWQEEFAGKY